MKRINSDPLIRYTEYLQAFSRQRAGFELQLDLPQVLGGTPNDIEQCLYRVAQEALENIVKHARAKNVSLMLARQDGQINLVVRDDGIGFDPIAGERDDHFGLRGICERVELVGGRVDIESEPGRGTTLQFWIDVHD